MNQDANTDVVAEAPPNHQVNDSDRQSVPTALGNLQNLIREKTRFESKDLSDTAEVESYQPFSLDVKHTLDAKLQSGPISGLFHRGANDKECAEYGSPQTAASSESSVRLQLAAGQLDLALKTPECPYNQIEDGVYLGHKTKHWYLRKCRPCSGEGSLECHTCHGKKKETCYRCSGGLYVTCDAYGCFGGKINCSSCGGSGQTSHQESRVDYGPNGSHTVYYTVMKPCNYCQYGKINCFKCGGTSRIQCPTCNALGTITCRTCHGIGHLTCGPCDGTGKAGEAAWVDVHVSSQFAIRLPEDSPEDSSRIVEKEGIHATAQLASRIALEKTSIDNVNRPSALDARYVGQFRVARLSATCNETEYKVVAYGQDLKWLTLDDIVEDLLRSDLRKLNDALALVSDDGLFASDVDRLLVPLQAVAASELNAEVVEAVLSDDVKVVHYDVVSEDYVAGIRTGILGSLRHIYIRLAKKFWWKACLGSLLTTSLIWLFFGKTWGALAGLLTLPAAYFAFNRMVLMVLIKALGDEGKAKRAVAIASKSKRDQLALTVVLAPSVLVLAGLGYLLPINGLLSGREKAPVAAANPSMATPNSPAPEAGTDYGQALAAYQKQEFRKARLMLEELITAGDLSASGLYGFMIVMGEGQDPSPPSKTGNDWKTQYALARPWIEKGLARHDPWAESAKGMVLTQALGEARNTPKGLEYLRMAAMKGNVFAMHALGMININGDHMTANPAEARKWFAMAAQQNSPADIYNLGLMDWNGAAISKPDKQNAMAQWKRAAQLGEERAIRALARGDPYR